MKELLHSRKHAESKTDHQRWGRLTWLASEELTGSHITLGRVVIKAGQANPMHAHDNCEEVLYLLQGRLEHTFGEETVILEAGDTIVVPPGKMHNAVSIGDSDAHMMVAYSSGQRDFRKSE